MFKNCPALIFFSSSENVNDKALSSISCHRDLSFTMERALKISRYVQIYHYLGAAYESFKAPLSAFA